MSAWESRAAGMRREVAGRVYRVAPLGYTWQATEIGPRGVGVVRQARCIDRAAAVAQVDAWVEAERVAAFEASQLALFSVRDTTQERAESASLLYTPGGAP